MDKFWNNKYIDFVRRRRRVDHAVGRVVSALGSEAGFAGSMLN